LRSCSSIPIRATRVETKATTNETLMDSADALRAIRREIGEQSIDLLLGFHDGAHFIEKPNAVMVLAGFKSLGNALVILPREDEATLVVTPPWDGERAAEREARYLVDSVDLAMLMGLVPRKITLTMRSEKYAFLLL
jgi:hypothetical protein